MITLRRSQYGTELAYLWEGRIRLSEVHLVPALSTFVVTKGLQQRIDKHWAKFVKDNPSMYNGKLCRFEGIKRTGNKLQIYVSDTDFATDRFFQHQPQAEWNKYPAAWGINVLQHTTDGYILGGLRTNVSDQEGAIGSVGAGFFDRERHRSLTDLVEGQCTLETRYDAKPDFYTDKAEVLAAGWNKDHNVAVVVCLPLGLTAKQVGLNNSQHRELVPIPDDRQMLQQILRTRTYNNTPVTEQLLGCFEQYLKMVS